MKYPISTVLVLLSWTGVCTAWVPSIPITGINKIIGNSIMTQNSNNRRSSTTVIYVTEPREKQLRQEIEDRQLNVEDDAKYGVPDGAYLETLDIDATDPITATTSAAITGSSPITTTPDNNNNNASPIVNDNPLFLQMQQMMKPRSYPLFLAEKFAEFAEATIHDVTKSFATTTSDSSSTSSTTSLQTNGASNNVKKERIVILGTGWGGASFLKFIDTDLYDVTIISPRNHFVFTPMLAGASVGTVEFRSICEPIRSINRDANFLEATATAVNVQDRIVQCDSVICEGNSCTIEQFDVSYDRLIVTVGAQTNTFGIPGVKEYCNYLRQVEDARRIRTALVNCFERANLPHLTDQERKDNLTFAIIGAGPTGIEFAAELRDFVEQDGPKYYPNLLKHVRIKIIEASKTVLAPFDKTLQQEAIQQMNRQVEIQDPAVQKLLPERFKLVELLLESSVKEVKKNVIELNDGTSVPYGLSVWAAGNGPIQLTLNLIDALGSEQAKEQSIARGRLAIDPWMRAVGSDGSILSFGDCSCVVTGGDGAATGQQPLPATAQVASQQGEYLATLFNKKFNFSPPRVTSKHTGSGETTSIFPPPTRDPVRTETSLSDTIASFALNTNEYAKPFQFLNLGILAYTGGGSALAQVTPAPNASPLKGTGKIGNVVWRSVYLSKQFSMRNRLLVLNDWTKRRLFGRDITRL